MKEHTQYRGGGPRDEADSQWKSDLLRREPVEPAKDAPEEDQRIYLSNRAAYYERETTRLALDAAAWREKARGWQRCCVALSAFAGTMVVGLFVVLILLRGRP